MKHILITCCSALSIIIALGSCTDAATGVDDKPSITLNQRRSVELNTKAIEELEQHKSGRIDFEKVVVILKKAIELDSANYAAYNNLVNVYLELNKVDSAYHFIQYLAQHDAHPDYLLFQGFIEERTIFDTAIARATYQKAIVEYQTLLVKDKDIDVILNYVIATYMAEGQAPALDLMKRYEQELATHPLIEQISLLIKGDDRKGLLNQLF